MPSDPDLRCFPIVRHRSSALSLIWVVSWHPRADCQDLREPHCFEPVIVRRAQRLEGGEMLIGARSYAYRRPDFFPFNELVQQN